MIKSQTPLYTGRPTQVQVSFSQVNSSHIHVINSLNILPLVLTLTMRWLGAVYLFKYRWRILHVEQPTRTGNKTIRIAPNPGCELPDTSIESDL